MTAANAYIRYGGLYLRTENVMNRESVCLGRPLGGELLEVEAMPATAEHPSERRCLVMESPWLTFGGRLLERLARPV